MESIQVHTHSCTLRTAVLLFLFDVFALVLSLLCVRCSLTECPAFEHSLALHTPAHALQYSLPYCSLSPSCVRSFPVFLLLGLYTVTVRENTNQTWVD